ncbi:hypothetical protein NUW58_g6155 [Xylaria curta]|uniref:Uncharacterized protein n=1 Tax=Xylaria curta TaxID=42375 RepID=A0ACC1NYN0_9PEZI|nr:hypothetical protein NUW58_g6155 [Xylaria curta]
MGPPLRPEPDQNVPLLTTDNLPETMIESSEDFESDGPNSEFDPDADVANTHVSNDELKNRRTTEECFNIFKSLSSLKDEGSREQIGSIPSKWCNEAIPLFEHDNAGYQLHFSYTWMEAIHTYTSMGAKHPETADWYLHCLAGVTENGDIQIVNTPLTIIPLGKLFKNVSGRSSWTGYEIFVSETLEVWIIYVPNEHRSMAWNTVDTGLFVPGGDQSHQKGTPKLAQFWPSLKDLELATFEEVQKHVSKSNNSPFMEHFYLLEISTYSLAAILVSRSFYHSGDVRLHLISEEISISCDKSRLACCQLLLLAKENASNAFVKLSPLPSSGVDELRDSHLGDYSLLWQAAIFNSRRIVDMIIESGNIDSYAKESDFSDVTLLYVADRFGMKALVKLILDRIQPNTPDGRGMTPFVRAMMRYGSKLVKLLLETGKVDVNQRGNKGRTLLDLVDFRVLEGEWKEDNSWLPGDVWVWRHSGGRLHEEIWKSEREYDLPEMKYILKDYTGEVPMAPK